jgi:hypothetical protein
MSYSISAKTRTEAKKLGVTVKPSKVKNKKIDVFKGDKKIASVGDIRYKDFHIYKRTEGIKKANERKRLYKIRHNKDRKKVGSRSYYADKLLWT